LPLFALDGNLRWKKWVSGVWECAWSNWRCHKFFEQNFSIFPGQKVKHDAAISRIMAKIVVKKSLRALKRWGRARWG
jgi:hypothetical protein